MRPSCPEFSEISLTLQNNPCIDLLSEFDQYLKKKNLAPNTSVAYHTAIRGFLGTYEHPSVENLQKYRYQLIGRYLTATVNQRIHALNHFLRFLEHCYPELYPELKDFRLKALKKSRTSFQDFIISNEDCQLLECRLQQEGQLFWYFVVRFLVTTGVRVSELTKIKIEHLSCGYLDLYSKGGKIRRIYITDSLCKEALEWCHSAGRTSGFIFARSEGIPVTTRGIHFQLKHFAKRYGIDPATAYPHAFRHRFAKNFLNRSGDISLLADLLGHESIETTRIYLTSSSREQQALLDELVTW